MPSQGPMAWKSSSHEGGRWRREHASWRGSSMTVELYGPWWLEAAFGEPNYAERPDHGKRSLVITCISRDPSMRPVEPVPNPFDFTLPREVLAQYHRRHHHR